MCCDPAVAFKIYDLKDTGVIEQDEVKRLLAALLQENPAIDLNDREIDDIVNQVYVCILLDNSKAHSSSSSAFKDMISARAPTIRLQANSQHN